MTNEDGLDENISMQAISDNAINITSDWEIICLNLDKNKIYARKFKKTQD